jgi:hypothetical protein
MASLVIHIGLGGITAAAGALVGGMTLLAMRILFTPPVRARARAEIRELGIIGATKRALFEISQPELELRDKRTAS